MTSGPVDAAQLPGTRDDGATWRPYVWRDPARLPLCGPEAAEEARAALDAEWETSPHLGRAGGNGRPWRDGR